MSEATSHKVSDSLYLVRHVRDTKAPAKPVEVQTNHLLVIDCSGSMSMDLPKIREQLKRKLPKLLKDGDTVSIVWFSGRGQFGTLLEAEPVATLADLKDVNAAIDRWLRPVGLTGFKEPLEEITPLIARISKKNKAVFSLFFMSDGCDNQWDRGSILKAVENAAGRLAAATFVEYGYYADRPLLSAMAEKAGGALIFSEDFDRFAPTFDAAMSKKLSGAPRVEEKLSGDQVCGFAFALVDGDLTTFSVEGGKVSVPEALQEIFYLSPSLIGKSGNDLRAIADDCSSGNARDLSAMSGAYAAVSLFSVRMKPDVVWPLLKSLGDVRFVESFSSCFGKQKYSDFMDSARLASFDPKLRYLGGFDPNKVPKDDAFTILDLLRILAEDDGNRLLLESPDFKYSRIGRGRVDASENLTAEELAEIQSLTAQIASEKDPKKIGELSARIASISSSKGPGLKFVADPAPDGYPISNLTFNEDRPNISVLVRKPGKVDVSSKLPDGLKGKVKEVETFVFRNYAIVKDGLVNVDKLPLTITSESWKKLNEAGMPESAVEWAKLGLTGSGSALINLKSLPVINRKMVKDVSAKFFFGVQYDLLKAQAAQKVYNAYAKELLPQKKGDGLAEAHGQEVADWLKEQGFTDYSGFSPKTVQAESTDFYMGKELKVSLKGYSKLPSVKELGEAVKKGKLNAPAMLMKGTYDEVEAFLASDIYKKAAKKEAVLEAWLDGQQKAARTDVRRRIYEIAQVTFCIVVGQIWFSEFKSLDENTMTIDVDGGQKIECKAELKEVQIKI